MNKKFSTLLVAALLSGGSLLSTVDAQTMVSGGVTSTDPSEYYVVTIMSAGNITTAPDDGSYSTWNHLAIKNGILTSEPAGTSTISAQTLWKATPVKLNGVATGNYTLTTAEGKILAFKKQTDGSYKYASDGEINVFTPNSYGFSVAVDGGAAAFLAWDGTNPVLVNQASVSQYLNFGFFAVDPAAMSISELNAKLNSGFGLQIGYYDANDKYKTYSLKGAEAFTGTLEAKDKITENTSAYTFPGLSAGETYIYNQSAKKFAVLLNKKWSKQNTDLVPATGDLLKGYVFSYMTAKELIDQLKADEDQADAAKKVIASYTFRVSRPNAVIEEPLEVAVKVGDAWAELLVAEVDGSYLLTTAKAVGTENKADYAATTYVKFGSVNTFDASKYYGYAVNIVGSKGTNLGKTLVPNKPAAEWESTDFVALSKPEGQWIITETALTNRESKTEITSNFDLNNLRQKDGAENVYYSGDDEYTITKVTALGENTFAYYGDFKADNSIEGEAQTYAIALDNKVTGKVNYVGQDGEGNIVLTENANAAVNFNLEKTATTDIMKADGTIDANNKAVDVFSIYNDIMAYNKDDKAWKLKENGDTIKYYRYTLEYNGKYLAMSGDNMALVKAADADNFVIKSKEGSTVNVINVAKTDWDEPTIESAETILANGKMAYFDYNYAQLKQATNIYSWVANAQLTVEGSSPVVYRTIAAPDTLEIFRTEYADECLFENGEFLGMTYNREKYNPALYLDTAYVRGETKKPFYMLAVNVEKTDATMACPIDGKADCEHAEEIPGMISARYLVALTDSVAAHRTELNNKFYYSGTKMTKLGFVPAVHHVDTLVVLNDKKEIVVGNNAINPSKFAFRIVNPATEDFVIETAIRKNLAKQSDGYNVAYVKWHNGCPVLTVDLTEAEVFNVRKTSENPTANEAIEAAGVQVIGGQGVVTVQGAAGKVITVANILGQTIANQVAASDNVTIAAPAGVVVVAVDGDATKVVVK